LVNNNINEVHAEGEVVMELIGTVEPDAGVTNGKAEWICVIEAHPQLSLVPPKKGINPFSKTPHLYRADPTMARVIIEGAEVGSIHWAMDDSRRLVVWSKPGAEEKVRGIASDVAARLGWQYVGGWG
jgi:hypothetical protein